MPYELIPGSLARMLCADWWYRKLWKMRCEWREEQLRAVCLVSKKASPYVSYEAVMHKREQRRKSLEFFRSHELVNEDGDTLDMEDVVNASSSNPAHRRNEMMACVKGLELIAEMRGDCVWTDGIGNTSGVIPGKTITERQAAEGLISNVLRVERALERCVKQQPPQKVYDAAVSFAFNVGTGNACSSTLVKLLNQRRWADACRQLPRWVYVKGVFNQGLDNRRAREMAWCLQGAN